MSARCLCACWLGWLSLLSWVANSSLDRHTIHDRCWSPISIYLCLISYAVTFRLACCFYRRCDVRLDVFFPVHSSLVVVFWVSSTLQQVHRSLNLSYLLFFFQTLRNNDLPRQFLWFVFMLKLLIICIARSLAKFPPFLFSSFLSRVSELW